MKNQRYKLFLLSISLLLLSACTIVQTLSGYYVVKKKLPVQRITKQLAPGKETVMGRGLYQGFNGAKFTCAGRPAYLTPDNAYSRERMSILLGHWSGGMAASPVRFGGNESEFLKHRHSTTCDENGRFTFSNIKPGKYYVETRLNDLDDQFPEGVPVASLTTFQSTTSWMAREQLRNHKNVRHFVELPRKSHIDLYLEATQKGDMPTEQEILEVQYALVRLGFNPGIPTGEKHKKTSEAIENFQRIRGIPQTGHIDQILTKEIDKALKEQTSDAPLTVWAFVSSSARSAHGAAAGRNKSEAFSKALRKCEQRRDSDPGKYLHDPCVIRFSSDIQDDACAAIVTKYFTWENYYGFSRGSSYGPEGLREEALQKAYEACGSHPAHCRSGRTIGPKMEHSYCSSDFR